jgi:uncharacterized membrane protein YedE/YeeE
VNMIVTSLSSGVIFGAGLAIAQMTNPAKVIGFLDISGAWDPSLAFVMGAALIVSGVAHQVQRMQLKARAPHGQSAPIGSQAMASIDTRLILGASMFGAGWGLAGFCPGPAIASLITGSWSVILFVGSMLVGMGLFELLPKPVSRMKPIDGPSSNAA